MTSISQCGGRGNSQEPIRAGDAELCFLEIGNRRVTSTVSPQHQVLLLSNQALSRSGRDSPYAIGMRACSLLLVLVEMAGVWMIQIWVVEISESLIMLNDIA